MNSEVAATDQRRGEEEEEKNLFFSSLVVVRFRLVRNRLSLALGVYLGFFSPSSLNLFRRRRRRRRSSRSRFSLNCYCDCIFLLQSLAHDICCFFSLFFSFARHSHTFADVT